MFITIVFLSLFTSLTLSSSNYPYQTITPQSKDNGFTIPLIDRINSPRSPFYNPNFTSSDRIQLSIKQTHSRYHHYMMKSNSSSKVFNYVAAPISPLHDVPQYITTFKIGTPSIETFAVIDTGSSLPWLQCIPCHKCYSQQPPIFNPANSKSFARLKCDDANIQRCSSDMYPYIGRCNPTNNTCLYNIHYLDGSRSDGELSTETFYFDNDGSPGSSKIVDITFGCAHNSVLGGSNAETKPPGVFGLDPSPLSFISQLTMFQFSYCLLPIGNTKESETSKMHFGSKAKIVGGKTPIIYNPKFPGYFVNLEGISVGNERLPIPPGTFNLTDQGRGGFIIDSGTSFTSLEEVAYNILVESIKNKTRGLSLVDNNRLFGLCYWASFDNLKKNVPNITFHFTGVDLDISYENAWIKVKPGFFSQLWCLAMDPIKFVSIFGNQQQRNVNVGYDTDNYVISFKPMDCTNT